MLVEERETLKEKIEKLSEENLKFESQLKELENIKKEFDLGMELKKKKVMYHRREWVWKVNTKVCSH